MEIRQAAVLEEEEMDPEPVIMAQLDHVECLEASEATTVNRVAPKTAKTTTTTTTANEVAVATTAAKMEMMTPQ